MSGKATLRNFKAMIADARLPERTVEICLRGDLVAEHEQAERALADAERKASNSLAGDGLGPLVDRIEELETAMREHVIVFTLRALPRSAWHSLLSDHPPRVGENGQVVDDDRHIELNTETFYGDLIRRSIVDPEIDDDDWAALNDKLTDRQFGDLAGAAWTLNRSEIDVPFSLAASRARRVSEAESS